MTEPVRTITLEDLPTLAQDLITKIENDQPKSTATIIALRGDLGAGKTAFTKALGSHLRIAATITSPTFIIFKRYDIPAGKFEALIHLDAYRLETEAELAPLHFEELIQNPKNLICVEWPDRVPSVLLPGTWSLEFTVIDETTRTVQVSQV